MTALSWPSQWPGYWRMERGAELKPAMLAFIAGKDLTEEQIATIRSYLHQWIWAQGFGGEMVNGLRKRVHEIKTRRDIQTWVDDAIVAGADPI
jgi:hypothetical protein